MRVVTERVAAEDQIAKWEGVRSRFSGSPQSRYYRTIYEALPEYDGEDAVGFVRKVQSMLNLSYEPVFYCIECKNMCERVVQFIEDELTEGDIYLCESCLERALEMLKLAEIGNEQQRTEVMKAEVRRQEAEVKKLEAEVKKLEAEARLTNAGAALVEQFAAWGVRQGVTP